MHGELREPRALLERRPAAAPSAELDLTSTGPRRAELFVRSSEPEPEIDGALATCFDFADGYMVNVWVGDY